MRKVFVAAVFMLLVLQVPAFAEEMKVGVVDMDRFSHQSEPGKYLLKQMEAKMAPMTKQLEKLDADLKRMAEDLKKQSAALSLESKRAKELEFKKKQLEIKELQNTFQQKFEQEDKKMRPPVEKLMSDVATKFAQDNGYDLILAWNPNIVVYLNKTTEITDALIAELNKAWKAQGH